MGRDSSTECDPFLFSFPSVRAQSPRRAAVFFQALDEFARLFLAFADGAGPGEDFVALDGAFDSSAGADDRAVVALAHADADFGEAELGRLADEVHRDASGEGDRAL